MMSISALLRRAVARRWRSPALPVALAMVVSLPAIGGGQMPAMPAQNANCPTASAGVTTAPSGPATVAMRPGPEGPMLVVGSGPNSGCALYVLTSDQPQASPPSYGCGAFCDTQIWPALLTKGSPIAGPGVNPRLLGTVARADVIGGQSVLQVTYAGKPLYQYALDRTPGQTLGEDIFDARTTPPGVWYLVSPARGLPLPGVATLAMESAGITIGGHPGPASVVLAALMNSDSGGDQLFPVYTFSADPSHGSACTGKCAEFWPPLLTQGQPQAATGVDARALGTIVRPDGSRQVTYDGRPLYLFIKDAPTPGVSNGDGAGSVFGGSGFNGVPLA